MRFLPALLLCAICSRDLFALDPRRSLTQYSRTVWTQQRGLPQDTIRALAQTNDGYLWLGTDEGLARFDGYDFAVFDKALGAVPDNSITALAAAPDGTLWIGTPNGLAHFANGRFRTYTTRDGLADNSITGLCVDKSNVMWAVSGNAVARFDGQKFTTFRPEKELPITAARAVAMDSKQNLWVAGYSRVVKREGDRFVDVLKPEEMRGAVALAMFVDPSGTLWLGSNLGVLRRTADGTITRWTESEGLPDIVVRALWLDRDGNLWAGTANGVARLERSRFVEAPTDETGVAIRCMLEDREGNLWIGANGGLSRWRSDVFTNYGQAEGLPSNDPNVVYQDTAGHVWIGFNDSGLMQFGTSRIYTVRDGLPDNAVFQIREARNGDLLVSTRHGLARFSGSRFHNFKLPDPLGRTAVFDAMETAKGETWLAHAAGLSILRGDQLQTIVPGGPQLIDFFVTLLEGKDGAVWAGTYGKGLWRVQGSDKRYYSIENGLSSDQIRSLYQDDEGTLWIATFGGGLNALKGDRIVHYTAKDGLLSDNIARIFDDGESLWLSTTRGICRIAKGQLAEFAEHKRNKLEPENYGVEDGLRSAQCAPNYPVAAGGARSADGRLWFTTGRGVAVLDTTTRKPPALSPIAHFAGAIVSGEFVDVDGPAKLPPRSRLQIRYTGIHLSAPERVTYSYRLDGRDTDWVDAGSRRAITYDSLGHSKYRFRVRAEVPGAAPTEASWSFEILPQFWETTWFRLLMLLALAAAAWAAYAYRLQQIRERFALVLEERARLAREIHDTLAQGFVGISSQLDAVAMSMPEEPTPARTYLELARRMARHSLTEARRAVMDLRASALEGQDLAQAIEKGTKQLTAGTGVEVSVEVTGPVKELPQEMEQHLLRIAQEAVTNVLKHAQASRIWVKMHLETKRLFLRIVDNGRGFDQCDAFATRGGHFGLLGMRERAERLGGELKLASEPGTGTRVEITVPLP